MNNQIKSQTHPAITVLGVVWKLFFMVMGAILGLAAEERTTPRYTASKAQQLYEDGAISGSEFSKSIQGE